MTNGPDAIKVSGMSAKDYFADHAVSRSQLHVLSKSPAHFKEAMESEEKQTAAFSFGTAFHTLILEPDRFAAEYWIGDIDRRTLAGKELAAKLADEGKTQISTKDAEALLGMKASIESNKYARVLIAKGEHETSYFWRDELSGIDCKCRPDCRTDLKSCSVIVDLKSCADASTEAFCKDAVKYGYDLQVAMYKEGVEKIENKEHRFIFVAVEKTPPYAVNVLEANDKMYQKGLQDFRYYLGTLRECLDSGIFPSYNGAEGKPNELGLPGWLAKEFE